MEKTALLLFCCLVTSLSGSSLYPSIRFGQRDTSILMTSLIENPADGLEDGASAEIRSGRHADAIFTNSYRKVLGQISARKILQTIMGKRLGEKGESYVKRQSDVYEGTYKDLTSIRTNQRSRVRLQKCCQEKKEKFRSRDDLWSRTFPASFSSSSLLS